MLADKKLFHQILIVDDGVSVEVPECTKTVKDFFPEVDYYLWENQKIRDFIKDNFNPSVLWAYDTLKPYAFKADLARYCLLYKLGGWYSDINNTFIDYPPNTDQVDFIYFMDIPSSTGTNYAVSNGLIYSTPGNQAMIHAIRQIVKNCSERFYGYNSLCVTGPVVLGHAIDNNIDCVYIKGQLVADKSERRQARFTMPSGQVFCLNKSNKDLPGGVVGVRGTNNYNSLWLNKDVYNDLEIY